MGGASYSVKFTEKDGVARDLRGIRKLDISDPPKGVDPCSPPGKNAQGGSISDPDAEKGVPHCNSGYVLLSDVKSYALLHNETSEDVAGRVQKSGCKIVDSLPQQ